MKIKYVRFIAWALIAFLAFVTNSVSAAELTFREYTRILIQAGVIPLEKAAIALEAAEVAEAERVASVKNVSNLVTVGGSVPPTLGVVVGPGMKRKVLVRAVGPGLRAFGVDSAMTDPRITAFKITATGPVAISGNDDWQIAGDARLVEAAFAQVGAFPLASGSYDSALLVELDAGSYTFVIEGVRGSTGDVLIENYYIP